MSYGYRNDSGHHVLVLLGVVVIIILAIWGAYQEHKERARCARGEDVKTGAMVCTRKTDNGNCLRFEPETKFVCYEYKAEATP